MSTWPSSKFVPISCVNTFIMIVGFRCGAINEPYKFAGISHFVEHLMFKSKSRESSAKMMSRFNEIGAQWNAHTELDYTIYYVKCEIKHAKEAMNALVNVVRSFEISEAEFKKEKRIVSEEISINPDNSKNVFRLAHIGTAYNNSVGGTETSLNAITLEDARAYHAFHYQQPILVYCCNKKHLKNIESWIGTTRPYSIPSLIDVNDRRMLGAASRVYSHQKKGHVESCKLAYLSYPMYDPRTYTCDLIAFCLSARLFDELREKRGMIYSIHVKNEAHAHAGCIIIKFESANHDIGTILRIVMKEIGDLSHKRLQSYRKKFDRKQRVLESDPWNATFRAMKQELYHHKQEDHVLIPDFDFKELFNPIRLAYNCKTSVPLKTLEKIVGL